MQAFLRKNYVEVWRQSGYNQEKTRGNFQDNYMGVHRNDKSGLVKSWK